MRPPTSRRCRCWSRAGRASEVERRRRSRILAQDHHGETRAARPDPLPRGERGGDPRPARRAPAGAGRGRRAARRRLHRRDHAGPDPHPLRREARPLPVHRPERRRRATDRRRCGPRRRLLGDGGRQALRQGLVARAQPRGRAARRHPPRRRRELRAHLPPERRQHRPLHLDRLRPPRPHRSGRGDRGRRARAGPRRARRGDPEERRPAALRPALDARRAAGVRGAARGDAAHAVREDRRPPCAVDRAHAGGSAARRRRVRSRRLALHPRVLHRHVRAPARRDLRRVARPAGAGPHRRLRGPHLVRRREPGARSRRPGGERRGDVPGAPGVRRAPPSAHASHAHRRRGRAPTTAATSPASRTR